jgi:hypothetical protein
MAWVKMPCACNATSPGGWHLELQTLIVLGGRANGECISSVRCPAGVDSRVIIDKAFITDWRDWSFVEVIRAVDLLVGRFAGITA